MICLVRPGDRPIRGSAARSVHRAAFPRGGGAGSRRHRRLPCRVVARVRILARLDEHTVSSLRQSFQAHHQSSPGDDASHRKAGRGRSRASRPSRCGHSSFAVDGQARVQAVRKDFLQQPPIGQVIDRSMHATVSRHVRLLHLRRQRARARRRVLRNRIEHRDVCCGESWPEHDACRGVGVAHQTA